jgi:hypothetical protein
MKNTILILLTLCLGACSQPEGQGEKGAILDKASNTVKLCQNNPHYLEYKGDPLILISSAEHYGAVLNLDFDYRLYLETLGKEGFNYTRIFTGTYIEPVENIFGIRKNTLSPLPGKFIAPWFSEEGKYDLERFNPGYFERLKDFLSVAEKQGIIVEVTLFTSIYNESMWALNPFNVRNNINGVGDISYKRVNTLSIGGHLKCQEAYIKKMVQELNGFDNFFFEIQNEPWSDNQNLAGFVNEGDNNIHSRPWQRELVVANDASMEWQAWVVSLITKEEDTLPKSHLIAQNICNLQYDQKEIPEDVSIINFHYAYPEAVKMNLNKGCMIGLDETGFMPQDENLYLDQAWRIILSGAGLYNNLDYSFTAGNERGDWPIPESNPGWGGPEFRKKLSILVETMEQIPYVEMDFSDSLLKSESLAMKQYGLQKPGELYLVFLEGYEHEALVPDVAVGEYEVSFINVRSGERKVETLSLGKGERLDAPKEEDVLAIMLKRSDL